MSESVSVSVYYVAVRTIVLSRDVSNLARPHECIQHLAVPGAHPSNYEPGAKLLNFSDRAQTVERTPYSVGQHSNRLQLLETSVGNVIRLSKKTNYDKMSVIIFLAFRSIRFF